MYDYGRLFDGGGAGTAHSFAINTPIGMESFNAVPQGWPTPDVPQPRYAHHNGWWLTTDWNTKLMGPEGNAWHLHSFTIDIWWKIYAPTGTWAGNLFTRPGGSPSTFTASMTGTDDLEWTVTA